MSLGGWLFVLVIAILVVLVVTLYNRLVALRQRAREAWSDIDVQLDLVPNLVKTVKGCAAHERTTLEHLVRARGAAVAATTPETRAQADGALTAALRQLFAVAEAYPELKANEKFQALQHSLAETEGALQNARRYYNGFFRFPSRSYFELERPADRQAPRVSFQS